jgi:hypothetical protein
VTKKITAGEIDLDVYSYREEGSSFNLTTLVVITLLLIQYTKKKKKRNKLNKMF